MDKVTIIGARPQLIGDTIFVEPVLNYWKNKYPASEISFIIAKKCQQAAALWDNHPLIDNILISDDDEGNIYTINGVTYNQKTEALPFDIRIPDFNPSVPVDCSYNELNCVEMAWKMMGLDLKDYYNLPREQQRPHLYDKRQIPLTIPKNIALWPFAGYNRSAARSPSVEWNKELVSILIGEGYTVDHYGHYEEPTLSNHPHYSKLTYRPFHLQVLSSLYSNAAITTDSGSGWVIGAYGVVPLVTLCCYHMPGHNQNPLALAPMQYNKQQVNLFSPQSCSDILHEDVIKAVRDIKL